MPIRRIPLVTVLIALLFAGLTLFSCGNGEDSAQAERDSLLADLRFALQDEMLDAWYPRVIDEEHGGYLSDFNYRWEPVGPHNKMIVTQARHVWTTSTVAEFTGNDEIWASYAAHGFDYLQDTMWDEGFGGFFNLVSRQGVVQYETGDQVIKRAYGNAFGMYGLAAYYRISGREEVLSLAQNAFTWLDSSSHDPEYGGYFQFMTRDGTPFPDGYVNTPPKDQNSSIHLLEAFTELYHVWEDETLRARLQEMLTLIRDTMVHDRGYLQLFFQRDWTPISYRDSSAAVREAHYHLDHVSFGHDVETAYLMLEASEALGIEDDSFTLATGKKMVDHALEWGWDDDAGGFYDRGYYFPGEDTLTIIEDTKNWWAQAEGLNTLLMMSELYPDDPRNYYEKFLKQWEYIHTYLIDHEHGGWYPSGLDHEPEAREAKKSHIWKSPYHTGRALMNCIRRLEE